MPFQLVHPPPLTAGASSFRLAGWSLNFDQSITLWLQLVPAAPELGPPICVAVRVEYWYQVVA